MTTTELEQGGGREELDEVGRWRRAVLRRAGFSESQARELAVRQDVDLHGAVDLVRRGCPPDLAFQILF